MSSTSLSAVEFQARWRNNIRSERASAQEHFIDLCRLVGFPGPSEEDPSGTYYTFERPVRKIDGRLGFADVWYKDRFAWEYKRRGADLDQAYQQLLFYREDLGNPPLLIVSDTDRIVIHTNFERSEKKIHPITTDDLAEKDGIQLLRRAFHQPDSLRPAKSETKLTEDVAEQFAALAVSLGQRGHGPRKVAHFLIQILFCLFAEDVGLLPKELFTRLLRYCLKRPDAFPTQTAELFSAMQSGGEMAFEPIARFNGGIFATIDPIALTEREIATLLYAAGPNWESVNPVIFGTLFERSLDPDQRKQLGAHYTDYAAIKRVIDPVLLAPLRDRWNAVQAEALVRKDLWDASPRESSTRHKNLFRRLLTDFQDEICNVRVLDPACGSGNFLYVALKELHDLEREVSKFGADNGLSYMLPMVSPMQMLGIELNPYARELAQIVVWIGHLQWLRSYGFKINNDPVIDSIEPIENRDALLTYGADGAALEATWPAADFIIGNPPFLGGNKVRQELGNRYLDDLFAVYDDRVPRFADLVCYFFEKARATIERKQTRRAGLLATNSIRGGANRQVLSRIKSTGNIFMAWSDEPWILNGAAVRISILGFDDGSETRRILNGVEVATINADLTSATDLTNAQPMAENASLAFMGDKKGAPFEVPDEQAQCWLSLPANPNGRSNGDVLRPWMNGLDITRRPRNMWIIDFGTHLSESEASLYQEPFEYVHRHCRAGRLKFNPNSSWWLHERPRPELREAVRGLHRYLGTARVAKHRLFVWLDADILPDSQVIAFARQDDYFFGVLHSRVHEIWSLRMGTSLEDRPRYTPTTCFETFPLPWPPGHEPWRDERLHAIADAAHDLDEKRRRWLDPEGITAAELKKRTLTNLYNERPAWLQHAHAALDRAVWAAYGWDDPEPAEVLEDVILERLLALNKERAEALLPTPDTSAVDEVLVPPAFRDVFESTLEGGS